MTRKRLAPARWTLPEIVDPPDHLCFEIQVPNEKYHLAAFLGAIYSLAKPYKWQNDADHTALAVGEVWLKIFDALRPNNCRVSPAGGVEIEDMSRFRIDPDDCSVIQIECQVDQWERFYPPLDCVPQGVTQPGPGGPGPGPGGTSCYPTILPGNGQFLLPITVDSGDIITISEADGGWTDGTGVWFCPDGSIFAGGICIPTGGPSGGDPMSTANHMALVLSVGGTFYDPSSPVTVPGGVSAAAVVFQANDSSLADNFGSIKFKICVQKSDASSIFTHTFDFTVGATAWHGFVDGGGTHGVYVTGQGWNSIPSGGNESLYMQLLFASTFLTEGRVLYILRNPTSGGGHNMQRGDTTPLFTLPDVVGSNDSGWQPINQTLSELRIDISSNGTTSATNVLVVVELRGLGTDPF